MDNCIYVISGLPRAGSTLLAALLAQNPALRIWCAQLPALAALFPQARVIACVRHVPWVIDSIESLIRRNLWQPSKMFEGDNMGTMWSRMEALAAPGGPLGLAWHALKQAFYSNEAGRMMVLTYETLTSDPARAMSEVYGFLGLAPFAHDFERVAFDAREFDARIGTPGLHSVRPKVGQVERPTILPPEIWGRFERDSFWHDPAQNPRGVKVV